MTELLLQGHAETHMSDCTAYATDWSFIYCVKWRQIFRPICGIDPVVGIGPVCGTDPVCWSYKYNKPIRNTILDFNKLVSDLDIHANTPESWDCKDSKFIYPAAGHIVTGDLKIISDSSIRYIVSKGPKYRFSSRIDFKTCREEIASALNYFCNRWCKRDIFSLMP